MDDSWYYIDGGVARGPVPLDELRDRFRGGLLHALDLVGRDGMPHWQFAGVVGGLVPVPWGARTGGPTAYPAGLDGLRRQVDHLFGQGLVSRSHFDLLAELLAGSPAARARPATRRLRLPRRGHAPDALLADGGEVFDAVACEVLDGDEILDAVDSGEDFDEGDDGDLDGEDDSDDASDDGDDLEDAADGGDEADDLDGLDDDLGGDGSDGDAYGGGGDDSGSGGGDYGGGGDDSGGGGGGDSGGDGD